MWFALLLLLINQIIFDSIHPAFAVIEQFHPFALWNANFEPHKAKEVYSGLNLVMSNTDNQSCEKGVFTNFESSL